MYEMEYSHDRRIGNFMYGVYGWMSVALLLTAITAYYVAITPAIFTAIFLLVTIIPISAQLADSPWPMHYHDLKHTSRSQYKGPDSPILKWKTYTGGNNHSPPVIGIEGTIFVGIDEYGFESFLYAIKPDGSIKWSLNLNENYIESSPAI